MNAEVIKAMNREKRKKEQFRKWWIKHGYKVMRVLLFPIWFAMMGYEWFNKWLNAQTNWSEKRAKEIFDYYIPRRCNWDNENKSFSLDYDGYSWHYDFAKKYLKFKDRRFWKMYGGTFGYEMREFLINKYELEGFSKEVLNTYGWVEIVFKLK